VVYGSMDFVVAGSSSAIWLSALFWIGIGEAGFSIKEMDIG